MPRMLSLISLWIEECIMKIEHLNIGHLHNCLRQLCTTSLNFTLKWKEVITLTVDLTIGRQVRYGKGMLYKVPVG